MLILNGYQFDPQRAEHSDIEALFTQIQSNQALLTVDWTKCTLSPQEIIPYYLPLVKKAHELNYRVELRIPLVLMSRFAYDANPIVFCGHTMNPFAFDDVKVILNKK